MPETPGHWQAQHRGRTPLERAKIDIHLPGPVFGGESAGNLITRSAVKFPRLRLFGTLILLATVLCAAPAVPYPPQLTIVPSGANQYTVSWEAAYSDQFNLES